MTPIRSLALLGLAVLLAPAVALAVSASADEAKVTVEGVHLCCGACVRGVDEAAAKVEAATVTADRDAGVIVIVAPEVKAAQAALDALTDAGYHGTSDCDDVKPKDDSGAPEGKVTSLTLTGAHNCCPGCSRAITGALDEVDGIESITAEARTETVTLTGDFDAKAAVSALNEAGFHVKVKKD
ncbi:heavy-metal-associated domain-containing protein [Tautonia sociabilis]|nr:cation transporter [Tautonia sociabilis]